MVSDFEHLAWHVKSLYLHVLFEQGVIGLTIFLAMLARAALVALRRCRHGDPLGVALLSALAGFAVLGFFASPIDAPRVATLLYLLLILALDDPDSPPWTSHAPPTTDEPARG